MFPTNMKQTICNDHSSRQGLFYDFLNSDSYQWKYWLKWVVGELLGRAEICYSYASGST